jgi:hypothetical protein
MKKSAFSHEMGFLILLMMIIVLTLNSCSTCKKIYKGDRLYYDFNRKELFGNKEHTDTINRPLIVKDNSEIQFEISNFNPLKYEIVLEDTAFNRFDPNIEEFTKYISYLKMPQADSVVSKVKANSGTPFAPEKCEKLHKVINGFVKVNLDLNSRIEEYRTYILYLDKIGTVYAYFKSLENVNSSDIKSSITENILLPIKTLFKDDRIIKSEFNNLFSQDFSDAETFCYQKIVEKIKILESIKDTVDMFSDPGCTLTKELKTGFYKSYKEIEAKIKEFETLRTNTIIPNLVNLKLAYNKLQTLAKEKPVLVTRSYLINKDINSVSVFRKESQTATKQLHDKIVIQMTCGFRIDVSGGLFVSGLSDDHYSMTSKDSIFKTQYLKNGIARDTTIDEKFTKFYKDPNLKISYGGMVFLQAHSQNVSFFNWGFYLGLGALFNEQVRWTGSAGLSFMLGRDPRCFINIGPSIAQVDRLKPAYEPLNYCRSSFNEIPISKVWKCNWLVGFSWRIGK